MSALAGATPALGMEMFFPLKGTESQADVSQNTVTTPFCINCGFAGATHWVNGLGPYCKPCSEKV